MTNSPSMTSSRWWRSEKPIVVAVSGLAVGIGPTMLLHCDLVYPFVDLALVPETAFSMLLPARIGHVRAFAILALGEALSGPDACALGLANKVLPKDELLPANRWPCGRSARASRPSD